MRKHSHLLTREFFLKMTLIVCAVSFPPSSWTLVVADNSADHISVISFLFPSKYCITSNRPISRCLFCLVPITSTFFSDTYLRLFLLFVASKFAITSGCALLESAFSRASAHTTAMGFCTVRDHCLILIPVW